ncbi:MAG: hypothetical protein LLG00_09090 [Planctomycetaceae bacterium]|nr:hypothetical protein [Planctomycetaceae bacterium]
MSSPSENLMSEARCALKELAACHAELRTFLDTEFDRWERLADELLAGEVARHETLEQAERAALEEQIQRLALVAEELTRSLPDHKQATKRT